MSESTGSWRVRIRDDGFTLVELVVAIALSAVIFTFLALIMTSSMRSLMIQKARTQGNEVATQGIEDLQRLDYDRLALCAAPPGSAPTDMSDTVFVTAMGSCPAASARTDPCNNIASTVADEYYTCKRRGTTYEVRRYVAWGDTNRTEKKIAVFVRWTDQAVPHTVSQQSSLRIPTKANVVGLPAPTISFPAAGAVLPAGGDVRINPADGALQENLTLTAIVSNPSPAAEGPDTVVVAYRALDAGVPVQRTKELVQQSDSDPLTDTFSLTVAANTEWLPAGSQYVTFTVIRKIDAKVNSRVATPALRFCDHGGSGCPANLPGIVGTVSDLDGTPSTIDIDANGALVSPVVRFTAATTNIRPDQSVSIVLQTLTGAVTIGLTPTSNYSCAIATGCSGSWQTDVTPAAGLLFSGGAQKVYFQAVQSVGGGEFEYGHSAADDFDVTYS